VKCFLWNKALSLFSNYTFIDLLVACGKMTKQRVNTLEATSASDGKQKYKMRTIPRAPGQNFSFMILFFGAGVLLGGTWSRLSLLMNPNCATFPNARHDGSAQTADHEKEMAVQEKSTESAAMAVDETAEKSSLRGYSGTGAFPIAWLMSFPNSGTSYTGHLVMRSTGQNTASNYGGEGMGNDGVSLPVNKESPEGPYWVHPDVEHLVRPKSGYLLTKTHCGGYCNEEPHVCSPHWYIMNERMFSHHCLSGENVTIHANGTQSMIPVTYSKDLVARAVHLIRDPFDNIVSRFHLAYKHLVSSNGTETIDNMYPRSREGFRAFCKDMGERHYLEEESSMFYVAVFEIVKNVPCHADFFRYIQWHNLAFATTWDLGIPTMVINYENYTNNFDETKERLLNFLDQEARYEPPPFEDGKTYREYFNEDEIRAVSAMFSQLAIGKTWDHTKHYFPQ